MPEDHFRQSCRHFNNNPLLVAPRYICSPKQVWLRMETLGLANYSKG